MSCKLNWYNLPQEINKIIKPYTNIKVYWYNLPISLNKVYKEMLYLKPSCNSTKKFQWFSLNKKAEIICELIDCLNTNEINFDVTASDWGSVVDASSFKTFLQSQNDETTNTVSNFSLVNGRLKCFITNIETVFISSLNITEINHISIEGLTRLGLQRNQIVTFNPTLPLPSSLQDLDLSINQIVTFNPTIPLPSSLEFLSLSNNQIVTFNPTIPLPSSLQNLQLDSNQIVTFNPTIPLPSSLEFLSLSINQIVTFNPTIPLPSSLELLGLDSNQMTTQGYVNSEPWANSMSVGTCIIKFTSNTNSALGTNLVVILQSKGHNVFV
jgi:Leucine-rich repeat (LRR) protein